MTELYDPVRDREIENKLATLQATQNFMIGQIKDLEKAIRTRESEFDILKSDIESFTTSLKVKEGKINLLLSISASIGAGFAFIVPFIWDFIFKR